LQKIQALRRQSHTRRGTPQLHAGPQCRAGVQKKVLPFSQVADLSVAHEALKIIGGQV